MTWQDMSVGAYSWQEPLGEWGRDKGWASRIFLAIHLHVRAQRLNVKCLFKGEQFSCQCPRK